jgi:glycosyltransferase involved in cell wall biosynthesis
MNKFILEIFLLNNFLMKNELIQNLKMIGQGLPVWAQMAARIPFLFFFAYEFFLRLFHCRKNEISSPCHSISIIITTLNEEKNVIPCIRSVSGNRFVSEVIVVDGGSKDQTRTLAQQTGARVIVQDDPIEKGGGRGGQIKAGIHAASGDVAVILHADTRLPSNEIDRMMEVLNRHPSIVGGSIGARFDSTKLRFRLIELANVFRAVFFKISFGDQVQFFRRKPVVEADLFPGIPLMEDVEFSIRLRRLGQCTFLFGYALVSTRRWEHVGFKNASWVFLHVMEYLIRRLWEAPDTVKLYRTYYANSKKYYRNPR